MLETSGSVRIGSRLTDNRGANLCFLPPPTGLTLPPYVSGIPTLILLDAEGHMITRQGRVEVLNDPECRLFPWHPRPVLELSESNAVQLHEGPCLVLFVGESDVMKANRGVRRNIFCSEFMPWINPNAAPV